MFNPCGMVVDYLSSFYSMPCLVTIAGQVLQTTVRWYRAPAGAKPLPFPTTFFSHINDADPGESIPGELGEVGFPRTWDAGRNPGYQGTCYRGDPAWFASGQLPALNSIAPSACPCQIPPAIAEGGLVLGGSAAAAPPCGACPTAPYRWDVTWSGGVSPWDVWNGTWTVTWVTGCAWVLQRGPQFLCRVVFLGPTGWKCTLQVPASTEQLLPVIGTFACQGTNTFDTSASPRPGFPASCVAVPHVGP